MRELPKKDEKTPKLKPAAAAEGAAGGG